MLTGLHSDIPKALIDRNTGLCILLHSLRSERLLTVLSFITLSSLVFSILQMFHHCKHHRCSVPSSSCCVVLLLPRAPTSPLALPQALMDTKHCPHMELEPQFSTLAAQENRLRVLLKRINVPLPCSFLIQSVWGGD